MSYSLSFSKAILVIVFISDKVDRQEFDFLSTAKMSEILSIPKPTLVKILSSLNMDGIIETKEGKQGGIRLARKPSEITVLDILNATERGKKLFHTSFNIMAEGKRPDNAQKSLSNLLNSAEDEMKSVLSNKTIAQILIDMSS